MLLAWVDGQLAALSALVGFPADQLAMVVCLLLNYPLGFLFLRLLGPAKSASSLSLALRHLYSTAPSAVFGMWLFGWDILHSLASSLVGYAILRAMAHRTSSCAKVMFVYAMAYVALSHIYRHTSPPCGLQACAGVDGARAACTTRTWTGIWTSRVPR
jgi:hypothetical protein